MLFTAANPATADPVSLFTRPCWHVPFQSEPVSLLGFVPAPSSVRLNRSHYLNQDSYDRFLTATGETIPTLSTEVAVE